MNKSFRTLSLILTVFIFIFSISSIPTFAQSTSEKQGNNIGCPNETGYMPEEEYADYGTDEEKLQAELKLQAFTRMNEIYFNTVASDTININKEMMATELEELEDILNKYGNGMTVSKLFNNTMKNPGDYQSKWVNMTPEEQTTYYYCGPASGAMVLKGKGISTSQSILAGSSYMDTDSTQQTYLWRVPYGLNKYKGTNGLSFNYAYIQTNSGESAVDWAIRMTNAAIGCLLTEYGTVYDTKSIGDLMLEGYQSVPSSGLYHYVAGYGFDSSDPSNRVCYYMDPNPNGAGSYSHTNSSGPHEMSFYKMGQLTKPLGLVF
ncbi:C39 family peptidase [Syntrophomonas wolfei]|jgi:hypothetical protein|uniref:C39 family peptidase n=1 Tax=Syntrophomonas wolfei TaxID=863 RepID=UPI0023F41071|nr:C39 family peptidase [Syntrophomonas wolfei]